MWTIALRILKDKKIGLAVYSLSVFLIVLMFAGLYPTILEQADELEKIVAIYPQAFLDAFGIDNFKFDTLEKFLGVEYFSLMLPILTITLTVGMASAAIAGAIERGTIEHLLARPVSRLRIFAGKYLGGVLVLSLFTFVAVFSTIPAALLFGVPYTLNAEFAILGLTLLFALSVFSIGMLFSALSSEKGRASLLSAGVMLTMYVFNLAASLIESLEPLQYTSLFYYYDYNAALIDFTIAGNHALVFITVIIGTTALAATIFHKRDIAV